MLTLDDPIDQLLCAGGDHRLAIEGPTGLSRYRVAPTPRSSVPLGSCTASSPSAGAVGAARGLLDRIRAGHRIEAARAEHRHRLRALFEIPPDTPVALVPSGTDAIYLASEVARRGAPEVHHVVVGASELGGGTLRAARGEPISERAPWSPGPTPIGGCTAEPIYLREVDGTRHEPAAIDERVAERVRSAARRARVVLHVVVHSKTGLRAPSARTCRHLADELGERLVVLVDAAQGRLAPKDVRQALQLGFVVLFTGSKFYSGPPFSGALLFPPALGADPGALPPALADWFAVDDLPPTWTTARASLRVPHNLGLTLRWESALHEIDAYHRLSIAERSVVYNAFSGAVYAALGTSPEIDLHVPEPPPHRLVSSLGARPTVFCFAVRGPRGYLDEAALRALHTLLDTDRGELHPALGGAFHLGQPVTLGPARAAPTEPRAVVLRVALGARLVSEHAAAPSGGASFFRDTLHALRAKIEAVVARGEVT